MANKFELPKDPHIAGKILETEHATRVAEMGKLGVWFGSRDNAVVYIAGIVILFSMISVLVLATGDSGQSGLRADMAKAFAALAISALGYLFGSSSQRSSHRD